MPRKARSETKILRSIAAENAALSIESVPVTSAGREAGHLVLLDPPRKSG